MHVMHAMHVKHAMHAPRAHHSAPAAVCAVTDFSYLFDTGSGGACETFNDYIGNWDVSSVTNMAGLFSRAAAFNQVRRSPTRATRRALATALAAIPIDWHELVTAPASDPAPLAPRMRLCGRPR